MTDYVDEFLARRLDWDTVERIKEALLAKYDDPTNSGVKYAAGFGVLSAMLSDNAWLRLAESLEVEL